MNTSNLKLRGAVAIALGLSMVVGSNAQATVYAPGSPFVFASEIIIPVGSTKSFALGSAADDGLTIDLTPFAGRTVNDVSPLEIRFTLTGGATFDSVSPISLNSFNCTYTGAASTPAINVLNGVGGSTTITFKMANGDIAVSSPKCVLGGGTNKVVVKLNSGQKDYSMTVSAQISGPDPLSFSTAGNIVTFTQAAGLAVTQEAVTIDVANPALSQKFIDGKTVAFMGNIQYKLLNTQSAMNVNASTPAALTEVALTTILTSTTKLVVTGSPLMAGGKVRLIDGGGDCLDASMPVALAGASETFDKTATSSGMVAFETITNAQMSDTDGIDVCYTVDGNTRIEKGNVTFSVESVAGSGVTPNLSVTDTVLTKFFKNGTSVKVLNIPSPTNATDQPYIRLYNMGSTSTKVYGAMYEQDGPTGGKLLGKNIELVSLDGNGVKVLTSADLAKAFSVADWKGRAWLQLEGDSQLIRVQALVRSGGPGGTLVNMSDRVLGDGDAAFRSETLWKKSAN